MLTVTQHEYCRAPEALRSEASVLCFAKLVRVQQGYSKRAPPGRRRCPFDAAVPGLEVEHHLGAAGERPLEAGGVAGRPGDVLGGTERVAQRLVIVVGPAVPADPAGGKWP